MAEARRFPMWLRLLLALSGTAYTAELMQTSSKLYFLITVLLSLFLHMILLTGTSLPNILFSCTSLPRQTVAALLSISAVYVAKKTFYTSASLWLDKLTVRLSLPDIFPSCFPWLLALAALPMAFGYFLWFTDCVFTIGKRLWQESDFIEHMYILGAGLLFAVIIVLAYQCTQAFFGAHVDGKWFNFDLIYSADSGYLVKQDVYRNVGAGQNDLRQPLFGVFAMPFAQAAWLVSQLLFFLPSAYLTVRQITQVLLFLISLVLVSRMLMLHGAEKALFLGLMTLSFPTLIFSLLAEQYLMAVFYLILMLYLHRDPLYGKLGFVAATGSLLTSGIWFPILGDHSKLREFLKDTIQLGGIFCIVVVLSGRLSTVLELPSYISWYGYYTGATVPALQRLMQFVNLVGGTLLAPSSGADTTSYSHATWQLLPVTDWSLVGICVFLIAWIGMITTRRDRFSQFCGGWMAFSIVLLAFIGWGTVDNGLMLYGLYFSWAYVAMVFRFFDQIPLRPLKLSLLSLLILLVGLYNLQTLCHILVFATEYFPALG